MVGLEVNLRGLTFKDIKITNETVDGKPVLVIEGMIVGETKKPVELPRLRFSVRDAQGAEIYAWNAVLEQPVLKPGERAWFKSRLASPPPEGRNIDVRFFNKRDLAGGRDVIGRTSRSKRYGQLADGYRCRVSDCRRRRFDAQAGGARDRHGRP